MITMKDILQIGRNQHLEPKEILRQRQGAAQTSEYLVKWNIVTQIANPTESPSSPGKEDESILMWMTKDEVEVCCSSLFGSGSAMIGSRSKSLSPPYGNDSNDLPVAAETEDFEDMRDDVEKLVVRARRQMKKLEMGDMNPIKNISYTLKVLSTYASLGSLATVFRQTGALDLILELLWSKDVETRRQAGKMLKALASHDGGSRAYVLLSLIQEKHGQMSIGDDADFENRNTVMEMFADTSSGEETHTISLDFMQLPQISGKCLFKLMKCYLKVTSLLDMDTQFGQLLEDCGNTKKKETPNPKANVALFGDRKFEVIMAIADLIFELCEVMGWNSRKCQADKSTDVAADKKPIPNVRDIKSEFAEKYQKELSIYIDKLVGSDIIKNPTAMIGAPGLMNNNNPGMADMKYLGRLLSTKAAFSSQLENISDTPMDQDMPMTSSAMTSQKPGVSSEIAEPETTEQDDKPPTASSLWGYERSHCIFASKIKEGLDQNLLADLIKNDTSLQHYGERFKDRSAFASEHEYEEYVRMMLRPGWFVTAIENHKKVEKGDIGVFESFDMTPSGENVSVFWSRIVERQAIQEHKIKIMGRMRPSSGNVASKDTAKHLPSFLKTPENSKLWPVLTGQDFYKLSPHPYSSGHESGFQDLFDGMRQKPDNILPQRIWWEVLFFIQRLNSDVQKQACAKIHDIAENGNGHKLSETLTVRSCKDYSITILQTMEIIRFIVSIDPDSEEIFQKSACCSRFLKSRKVKKDTQESSDLSDSEKIDTFVSASSSQSKLSKLDEESAFPDFDAAAKFVAAEEDTNKVHRYLDFLCHQSSRFLDTFLSAGLTSAAFNDLVTTQFRLILDESSAEDALDRVLRFSDSSEKILGLMCFHSVLKKELKSPYDCSKLNKILVKSQTLLDLSNMDLCIAWMQCIDIILHAAHKHGSDKMQGTEVVIATSGSLAALIKMLKSFPRTLCIALKAIRCWSRAIRAVDFWSSPTNALRAPEAQVVRAVIDSIASASQSSEKTETSAFIDTIQYLFEEVEKSLSMQDDKGTVKWSDIESFTLIGSLYEAMCICNFMVTDQKEIAGKMKDVCPIISKIISVAPAGSPLVKVCEAVKTKIVDDSTQSGGLADNLKEHLDQISDKKATPTQEEIEKLATELLDPEQYPKLANSMEKLLNSMETVMNDDNVSKSPQIQRIYNTVLPAIFLPNMSQKMSATELSKAIDIIEHILFESNQATMITGAVEEKHRSGVIYALLQTTETLSNVTMRAHLGSPSPSTVKEIIGKAVSLLQRIANADKDLAVVMCGMDAKLYLSKAIEKNDSIPKASELIEFLSSYDRYRTLHSKLLVVILGGTIGVALRCMEDARRMQVILNIPLLDGLFASLCKGSDFDVKEDKCWEKIEVSSNQRQAKNLTDGNSSTYWESNGSSGSHWISVHMKKGVIVRKLSVQISQEDSSYMPARLVVVGLPGPSDFSQQLNVVTVSNTTESKVVVLENEKRYWPIIRICVRRCQQGGIDTRIRGIEIVGPKPSFWPVLKQQLCIRTCLSYFVRARTWIATCTKPDEAEQPAPKKRKLMNHGILKLSSKIVEAIRHEQKFANHYLPNDESSMVLGQAFRNAVIHPFLSAIQDASSGFDDGKPIIFHLLSLYLDLSNPSTPNSSSFETEQMEFLSRLRRLTRLLVDLNPSQSFRLQKSQISSIQKWSQTMQSKSGKDDDSSRTEKSKTSNPPSMLSLLVDSSSRKGKKEPGGIFADDMFDPLLGGSSSSFVLMPLASQWCNVVSYHIRNSLTKALNVEVSSEDLESMKKIASDFCEVVAKEFECLLSCTSELFGNSAQYFLKLVRGISTAILCLDIHQTVTFSKNVALSIHDMLTKSLDLSLSPSELDMLNTITNFMFLSNGLNWGCIFEPLYCSLLASRLLNNEVCSVELEKKICSILRSCFPDNRPTLMLQDISHSKVLWNGFLSHRMEMYDTLTMLAASDELTDEKRSQLHCFISDNWRKFSMYKDGALSVQVLSPVPWRVRAIRKDAIVDSLKALDPDLLSSLKDYEDYFASAYQRTVSPNNESISCPLHWTAEGWADIRDTVTGQVYRVTTSQMLLLLQFEASNSSQVEITPWKYLLPNHWDTALESLVEAKVLQKSTENTVVLHSGLDSVVSTRKVINITPNSMDEANFVNKKYGNLEVFTERRHALIDCAIIQCLKSSSCHIDALIFHVIKHCLGEPKDQSFFERTVEAQDIILDGDEMQKDKNHFYPLSSEIISRCEMLMDLGYIKRDTENPQLVSYVPEGLPVHSRRPSEKEKDLDNAQPSKGDEDFSQAKKDENEGDDKNHATESMEITRDP